MGHKNDSKKKSKQDDYMLDSEEYEFIDARPPYPGAGFPGGVYYPPPGLPAGPGGPFVPPIPNVPGGNTSQPPGPPPKYIPNKGESGVNSFKSSPGSPELKSVSPNSISFCLYNYIYIWEMNGREYWAYLLSVDRRTAAGLRWFRGKWVYFGVDLKNIDSFICYRSESQGECSSCNKTHNEYFEENKLAATKKEYLLNEVRDVYTRTLASINISEDKNDYITETIGVIEDINVESKIPCLKTRDVHYRVILEVSYPENIDDNLKEEINSYADASIDEAGKIIHTYRKDINLNPIDIFNDTSKLAGKLLSNFSMLFSSKISNLKHWKDAYRGVNYTIRQEKIIGKWKIKH